MAYSSFEVHAPVSRSASADYLALILGVIPDFPLCLGQTPGFGFSSGITLSPYPSPLKKKKSCLLALVSSPGV